MSNRQNATGQFPMLLASTVHDIKTSLGVVLELMRQIAVKQTGAESEEFSQLEFETLRINHSLMQLLVMFKIDCHNFDIDIDEYSALDIIHEAKAQQDVLSKIRHIQFSLDCSDELYCYCDYGHIANALGTILNNSLRYTSHTILMSAERQDEYVVFTIEDDGEGYPEHFLQADFAMVNKLDWVNGNTGLGLYFVAAIAKLHKNKQKQGFIKIDNQSSLGGARFRLYLP